MIKATMIHQSTLTISDKRTANLAELIHNMGELRSQGLMTNEMFVHIHDILRENLETENFISVVGYLDNREETNEYHILVSEFPEKSDGTIRSLKKGEGKHDYFLLTEEDEEGIEQIIYLGEEHTEALNTMKKGEHNDLVFELAEFVEFAMNKLHGKDILDGKKMRIYYSHEKLEGIEDAVLVKLTEKKEI